MKFMAFLISFLISFSVYAKTITLEIPDVFSPETTLVANYDGSVTVNNPQVAINGEFVILAAVPETAASICKIIDYTWVVDRRTDLFAESDSNKVAASLFNGKINKVGIIKKGDYNLLRAIDSSEKLTQVICRKERY